MLNPEKEIKTMSCQQQVTFNRGITRFSCTGYSDNRYNCSACIVLHRSPVIGKVSDNGDKR